jgi:large subunit ribosomal protein L5
MADYIPRMKRDYDERIVKAMTERFGYTNVMEVPRIEKITSTWASAKRVQDKKKVETAAAEKWS